MFVLLFVFSLSIFKEVDVVRTNFEIEDITGIVTDDIYLINDNGLLVKNRIFIDSNKINDKVLEIIKNLYDKNNSQIPNGLYGIIPNNVNINSVNVDEGVVTIDFSKEFLESNNIRFSKATLSAIRKNILNARVEFNINNCKFSDYEIYKSNGYTKFKYNCVSSKNSFKYDSLVHIYPKEIQLGDIELSNKDTYNNPCKLLSSNYDNKTNETCLEYKLDGLRVNSGFDWLRGTVKLYIPTDIMNASESYNLDCKLYDEFMED
jgi:hypothetical protein